MPFIYRVGQNIGPLNENFLLTGTGWTGSHTYMDGEEAANYHRTYFNPSDSTPHIERLNYEGWRRDGYYGGMSPSTIGFHITMPTPALAGLLFKELASLGFDAQGPSEESLREQALLDARGPNKDGVTSCATKVVTVTLPEQPTNATYVDDFFAAFRHVATVPPQVIQDVKAVIAETCVIIFKRKLVEEMPFDKALSFLRPCALKDVSSPYFLAAEYCLTHPHMQSQARELFNRVPAEHWQYKVAREMTLLVPVSTSMGDRKVVAEGSSIAASATAAVSAVTAAASPAVVVAPVPAAPPVVHSAALAGGPSLVERATSTASRDPASGTPAPRAASVKATF